MTNASGIVLDIDFAEKSGAVAGDASRYGNDGALTGCKWVEHGLEFNGTTDYVDCGNDASLDITDAITVSAWFKTIASDMYIVTKSEYTGDGVNRPYNLRVYNLGILDFFIHIGDVSYSVSSSLLYNDDENHNVFGVYDGGCMYLYIDGILIDSNCAMSGNIDTNVLDLNIGGWGATSYRMFDGSIDDVRISNRALNASEIKAYYDSTKHIYR